MDFEKVNNPTPRAGRVIPANLNKMFSLRVNFKTKVLVTETAEMCGIPVSEVFRVVALWIKRKRLSFADSNNREVEVSDRSKNVIIYEIGKDYHEKLDDFLTADITMPEECGSQKEFRSLLVAACLDTHKKVKPEWDKKQDLDKRLKELQYLPTMNRCGRLLGVL